MTEDDRIKDARWRAEDLVKMYRNINMKPPRWAIIHVRMNSITKFVSTNEYLSSLKLGRTRSLNVAKFKRDLAKLRKGRKNPYPIVVDLHSRRLCICGVVKETINE